MFTAASMEANKTGPTCKQTMLLIDAFVYTSLPFTYNLTVLETGNVDNIQIQQVNQNNLIININNLKEDTNYSVIVSNDVTRITLTYL